MNNNIKRFHTGIPCTSEEAEAIKNYCYENGLILGQLARRLLLKEVQEKSTISSPDFIIPSVKESLIIKKRG